jgi:hypothetical protein
VIETGTKNAIGIRTGNEIAIEPENEITIAIGIGRETETGIEEMTRSRTVIEEKNAQRPALRFQSQKTALCLLDLIPPDIETPRMAKRDLAREEGLLMMT